MKCLVSRQARHQKCVSIIHCSNHWDPSKCRIISSDKCLLRFNYAHSLALYNPPITSLLFDSMSRCRAFVIFTYNSSSLRWMGRFGSPTHMQWTTKDITRNAPYRGRMSLVLGSDVPKYQGFPGLSDTNGDS
jgi:hypothetical protein